MICRIIYFLSLTLSFTERNVTFSCVFTKISITILTVYIICKLRNIIKEKKNFKKRIIIIITRWYCTCFKFRHRCTCSDSFGNNSSITYVFDEFGMFFSPVIYWTRLLKIWSIFISTVKFEKIIYKMKPTITSGFSPSIWTFFVSFVLA